MLRVNADMKVMTRILQSNSQIEQNIFKKSARIMHLVWNFVKSYTCKEKLKEDIGYLIYMHVICKVINLARKVIVNIQELYLFYVRQEG